MFGCRIFALFIIFLLAGWIPVSAQESNFSKANAVALKGGYHFYSDSKFFDYWKVSPQDFNGFSVEISYERTFLKYFSLEIPFGYTYSKDKISYQNIIAAGDSGQIDLSITNIYLSPSLKFNLPIHNVFQIYLGIGPDFYYTILRADGNYTSTSNSGTFKRDDNMKNLGVHGLAGLEYSPLSSAVPLSIFLEYKYTYVKVDDFDKIIINELYSITGTLLKYHDFNAGGHFAFLGIRYRF